jgi:hypothetical protein
MIYTTFKQWVKGRFLETGEPRKKAYSKDERDLIEMGWGYGYDAGVIAEREACAKIADLWSVSYPHPSKTIAETIRKRGEE